MPREAAEASQAPTPRKGRAHRGAFSRQGADSDSPCPWAEGRLLEAQRPREPAGGPLNKSRRRRGTTEFESEHQPPEGLEPEQHACQSTSDTCA